ncbi:MAG TPA: hypothetical protein DGT23_01905 [Micromonosporaceae bacterium]|nr:hypothetical protein [Micromonosporaceae bacterium]
MVNDSEHSADRVIVDIGSANRLAAVTGIVLFGLFMTGGIYTAVDTQDTTISVIGYCVAGLFAVPLIILLRLLPVLFRSCGLAFSHSGLQYWEGRNQLLIPWHEVAAIGIGYEQPPELPSLTTSFEDAVKSYAAGKAKETLKVDGKRRIAVEIFPIDAHAVAGQPLLCRYRSEQTPPAEELHSVRWRLPIPPVVGVAGGIERGVRTFHPDRWLGWFARPWSGGALVGRRRLDPSES